MAKMKTAVIIYLSSTGNTEKVAKTIQDGLEESGIQVTMKKPSQAKELDFFDYDLVCVGSPSIQWHPAKPIDDFLKSKLALYRNQEKIKPQAPKIAGKNALIFITYSGPHTGIDEATPAGKYIRQFFEHLGFNVLDELYVISEYKGSIENSTEGKLGDIRGKPTQNELQSIKTSIKKLAQKL